MSVSRFVTLMLRLAGLVVVLGASVTHAADADPQAGKKLTAACAACHGADGNSVIPANPSLAGQNQRYLFRQLQMIQSNARSAPLMAGQLNGMG